jgi:hypothetical protein
VTQGHRQIGSQPPITRFLPARLARYMA